MSIADIKKNAEAKMAKSIEAFKHELTKIRTGRAHPGLLDQVHVEYYGSMVPISQVANVSLIDARTISVQPGGKGMAVRNLRRDANEQAKKLQKDKLITEDDERRSQDEVQKLTDRTIAEIDKLIAAKEAEILAV